MPDITTPVILDTLAAHLRRCAVLVDDPDTVDDLMTLARKLDDRAQSIREDARRRTWTPPPAPPDS